MKAYFCDLSKAFDLVDHDFLLNKLSCYGIQALALELIKSYLSSRRQKVYFQGEMSNEIYITCGVPQGSVLGPLLILVMLNDFSSNIISKTICM